MTALPCIRCDKALESVLPEALLVKYNQPYGATTFISYGQYGSTVFDPNVWDDATAFLEVNVCDECLLKLAQTHIRLGHRRQGRVSYTYEDWTPDLGLDEWRAWFDKQEERRNAAKST